MQRIKGVAHVHSSLSFDGKLRLAELREFLVSRGLDFVLMSEHVEGLSADAIRSFIAECRELSSDRFVIVPGIEIHDLNLLIFGIRGVVEFSDATELIEQFRSQNALFILAHPRTLRPGVLAAVSGVIEGVEIWNGKYDGKKAPRMSSVELFEELSVSNRSLVPTCGLDFHRISDYTDLWMELDARKRSEEELLFAIRSGNATIHGNGHPVPVLAGSAQPASRGWFRLRSISYTTLYDSLCTFNRCLNRLGLRIPAGLRLRAKKYF